MTSVQREQYLQKFSAASVKDISQGKGDVANSISTGQDYRSYQT